MVVCIEVVGSIDQCLKYQLPGKYNACPILWSLQLLMVFYVLPG